MTKQIESCVGRSTLWVYCGVYRRPRRQHKSFILQTARGVVTRNTSLAIRSISSPTVRWDPSVWLRRRPTCRDVAFSHRSSTAAVASSASNKTQQSRGALRLCRRCDDEGDVCHGTDRFQRVCSAANLHIDIFACVCGHCCPRL